MKWYKRCSFLLIIIFSGCAHKLQSLYVDLGNATVVLPAPAANVYRLFFDRTGSLYPNTPLSRAAMSGAGYLLNTAFDNDTLLQKELLQHYTIQGKNTSWQQVQQVINQNVVNYINKATAGYSTVTVLIHGIGNDINQDNRLNRNPYDAFRAAEQRIDNLLQQQGKRTFFLEVYWDALHRIKRTDFTAVFAGAGTNAYYAGLGLRRVVSQLQTDSLVILTHSLGAKVGCQLLFNLQAPRSSNGLQQFVTEKYADTVIYRTPPQSSIRLGMLVPAIPGISTFQNFYNRTGYSIPEGSRQDRYTVWVGYNNKDRIITKNIIAQLYSPLLVKYAGGSTALGALRSENKKVAHLFLRQFPQSSFTAIDFQDGGGKQSPQTAHYFSNYCNNQHFPELVRALYNL